MLRVGLLLLLFILFARAFWRLVDGVIEGVSGQQRRPLRAAQMVRDPVCGTFVVPNDALALTHGGRRLYFCSAACRDKYRLGPIA
jgi:YHS domain-containing protein